MTIKRNTTIKTIAAGALAIAFLAAAPAATAGTTAADDDLTFGNRTIIEPEGANDTDTLESRVYEAVPSEDGTSVKVGPFTLTPAN